MRRTLVFSLITLAAVTLTAQSARTPAPRLWTDQALKAFALPIAGVNAAPTFYSEAEYYAAPVDELRTYPVYVNGREPKGYRDWMRGQGPKPLIEIGKSRTEAEWVAEGREIFDGLDIAHNRTDDPRAIAWVDEGGPEREHALITKDGVVVSLRWVVDHDRKLKLTINECGACHTRALSDGTAISGAQGNLNFNLSFFGLIFEHENAVNRALGRSRTGAEAAYANYGVPWLAADVNAGFKTMAAAERDRIDGPPQTPGTFPRFGGSPYFTNHMPDLIGVKDRRYLDATATHRNRGPEDVARYGILVTDADDGAIGPHRFQPDHVRALHNRHSDDAMYAIGKYVYALEPPNNSVRRTFCQACRHSSTSCLHHTSGYDTLIA